MLLFSFRQVSLAQPAVDLVIHHMEATPLPERMAYDVRVYFSVVGGNGSPIRGLDAGHLTVLEDGQKVAVEGLERVGDEPIYLVLVLDTSGSMVGPGIEAARAAAAEFVGGLDSQDRVAILTFDNAVQIRMDPGNRQTAREQIARIEAVRGAGTCLYDAAYQAVQISAAFPSGRRAVILFTDGVDENAEGNGPCSVHTLEDVIALTSTNIRAPIYTLGLGRRIDANTLQRLAERSGGRYLYSPDASKVEAAFLRLAEQLRTQYLLRYISTSGPGAHSVTVGITYEEGSDLDTRTFLLPPFPIRAALTLPQEGQPVSNTLHIAVTISGQGEPIDHLTFQLNGQEVGRDDTRPYEADVDVSAYPSGEVTVTAIVYGIGDVELTRASGRVAVVAPPPTATPTELPPETATPTELPPETAPPTREEEKGAGFAFPPWLSREVLIGGGGGLAILLAILVFALVAVRRRAQVRRPAPPPKVPPVPVRGEEPTYDLIPGRGSPGVLVVENSDDPVMVGYRFEITRPVVTLGRSADNDLVFPQDRAVSRHHARIEERGRSLFLSEVETLDQAGRSRRPTYGTTVNGVPVGPEGVSLQHGDEIVLGKRLRLRFLSPGRPEGEALTYDQLAEDHIYTLG